MAVSELRSLVLFRDVARHPFLALLADAIAADESDRDVATSALAGLLASSAELSLKSILVESQNAYALHCERGEDVPLEIALALEHDLAIFNAMLAGVKEWRIPEQLRPLFSLRMPEPLVVHEAREWLERVWRERGAGVMAVAHFFRWSPGVGFVPVNDPSRVLLDDIAGYAEYKELIAANTRSLAEGLPANNILLAGSRGTGKSSLVKAVGNEFARRGVKVVELEKANLPHLRDFFAAVAGRGVKFVLFLDDISFDENEAEFRTFKSALEGCVERKPENVVIYATSNRRHMVPEKVSDGTEDIYAHDTSNEKVSLSDRFGITLYFLPPDRTEYLSMAHTIASRSGVTPGDDFDAEAERWALEHKGRSGRSAEQFVRYYGGMKRFMQSRE